MPSVSSTEFFLTKVDPTFTWFHSEPHKIHVKKQLFKEKKPYIILDGANYRNVLIPGVPQV